MSTSSYYEKTPSWRSRCCEVFDEFRKRGLFDIVNINGDIYSLHDEQHASKIIAIKFLEYWVGAAKCHKDSTQWTLDKRLIKRTIFRLFAGNGILLFRWRGVWYVIEIPENAELSMFELAMSCSHRFLHARIVETEGGNYLQMLSGEKVNSMVIDHSFDDEI